MKIKLMMLTYSILFDKVYKRRPFDLYRLTLSVVQSQYKVEKVTLPQVTGWLLLKVSASHGHAVNIELERVNIERRV